VSSSAEAPSITGLHTEDKKIYDMYIDSAKKRFVFIQSGSKPSSAWGTGGLAGMLIGEGAHALRGRKDEQPSTLDEKLAAGKNNFQLGFDDVDALVIKKSWGQTWFSVESGSLGIKGQYRFALAKEQKEQLHSALMNSALRRRLLDRTT